MSAVAEYRARGWHPLPLPLGRKEPVPMGYTGRDHTVPDDRVYERWEILRKWGNIALVMPEGVIGYDLDVYHGGQLPPDMPHTMRSTSRDDGSGIHLYAIPPGIELQGKDGPGVEILQYHHRYAVVWPSLHPETRLWYDWLWPDGTLAEPPDRNSLPELPLNHLKRLQVSSKNGKKLAWEPSGT